jgi:hypothetical protein
MKLLWTKSSLPLSSVIRFCTGNDCSHFSIVFESPGGGMMFESNFFGTHPTFYKTAMKSHTVMHEIEVKLPAATEDALWDLWVDKFDGLGYDFFGALYLGLMCLRERWFKIPRPKTNKWAKNNSYFCDEIYILLSQVPGLPKIDAAGGMDTPHDVWDKYVKGGD